jgi:regulator of sigma E protease
MFLTIITFIIVFSLLIFAHELGHFWTARKFGIKAEEFGFGFPPRIGGIYKNGEGKWKKVLGSKEVKDSPGTIYSLNWIPLGGFVKIKGENGENENELDSFAGKKIWQRAVVLSAGVGMNIILAMVLISFGLMIGLPETLDNLPSQARISEKKIQIAVVMADSPAEKAGLVVGDTIISIDKQDFANEGELQNFVAGKVGEELNYEIKRGREDINLKITPEIRPETDKGGVGIAIAVTGLVKYPWYLAIWEGAKTTIFLTWAIVVAFYELFKNLIIGHGLSADVAGPVGIAALTGQVAQMGFVYVLQFTVLLSINLAIINFLPLPALDGGRILFLIIEKIKGSPVKREIEATIHNIGFSLLMLLVLIVTFKDIARFGDNFRVLWETIINKL